MSGNVARAVRIRQKPLRLGVVTAIFWVVLPARTVGKGSRTQIGPVHLSQEQAYRWAQANGYLVLGVGFPAST